MQIRLKTLLTGEQYVSQQAWRSASLLCCPLHPRGGCGFARHGTYARLTPPGTRIARWYCPRGHCTFSLLPDCLAASWAGTLAELEAVVVAVERRGLSAAADTLRPDIDLPGAMRWTRRRVKAVHATLERLKGLLPEALAGVAPLVLAFCQVFAVEQVLAAMRAHAADWLPHLPPPFGLSPRGARGGGACAALQHSVGPDPPPPLL